VEDVLYTEADLLASMDKIDVVNFHQVVHHKGIKFWAYNAGHVLGAAMFVIEIAGVRILYTGDYSRREDRHLMSAELPNESIDVLVVEATYGIQRLPPVSEREQRFTELVRDIVERRRGKALLPVFALGRAQELLLILDEFWSDHTAASKPTPHVQPGARNNGATNLTLVFACFFCCLADRAQHPALHSIPIYYASALAKKVRCSQVAGGCCALLLLFATLCMYVPVCVCVCVCVPSC